MSLLPTDVVEGAKADKDGRRLAARLFAELGVADGVLMVPRFEAELAVALAIGVGADLVDHEADRPERQCRVCGCTKFRACRGPDGPCSWVAADLCSVCAAYPEPV